MKNLKQLENYIHFYLNDNDGNQLLFFREYIRHNLDETHDVDVNVTVFLENYSNLLLKFNNAAVNFDLKNFISDFAVISDFRDWLYDEYIYDLDERDIKYDLKQFNPVAKIIREQLNIMATLYGLSFKEVKGNKYDLWKKLEKRSHEI